LVSQGFERAPPSEIVGQVLGGDAVEAVEPLLEAAVVGVDVVDVQVRGLGGRLSRRGRGVERNPGFAGESGDRLAAVADEVIARRDDPGERGCHRSAVDLRQDGVEGRSLPVPGDKDGNVVLIKASLPGRSAPLARLSRQIGSAALEGFEDESLVGFDDPP
jgi:hypothetical protein